MIASEIHAIFGTTSRPGSSVIECEDITITPLGEGMGAIVGYTAGEGVEATSDTIMLSDAILAEGLSRVYEEIETKEMGKRYRAAGLAK